MVELPEYYDTYLSGEPEKAFALLNPTGSTVEIGDWQVTDGEGTVVFPAYTLGDESIIWVTKTVTSFEAEFGFPADFEYGGNSDPNVPDMTGTPPTFTNSGNEITLMDAASTLVDALVYEGGDTAHSGWSGAAIFPYDQGSFGLEGQILYRKLDPTTGMPFTDTNTASDWAQDSNDDVNGKKVRYPGWDLEHYFQTY